MNTVVLEQCPDRSPRKQLACLVVWSPVTLLYCRQVTIWSVVMQHPGIGPGDLVVEGPNTSELQYTSSRFSVVHVDIDLCSLMFDLEI